MTNRKPDPLSFLEKYDEETSKPYFLSTLLKLYAGLLIAVAGGTLLIALAFHLAASSSEESPEWREYQASGCAVVMPKEPREYTAYVQSLYPPILIAGQECQLDSTEICQAVRTEPMGFGNGMTLESTMKEVVGTVYSQWAFDLIRKQPVVRGSYTGVEYELKSNGRAWPKGQTYTVRAYWISPRMYVIGIGGADSGAFAKKRLLFLDSFRVITTSEGDR